VNTRVKGVHPADVVMLLSRLLLAWIFLHEGLALATNLGGAIAAMAKLGVDTPLVLAAIALQIGAGISIAFGCYVRLGALALAIFCLMTALLFHTNFANHNELLHFEKDLAIAGGMLALVVGGAGSLSVDNLLAGQNLVKNDHIGGDMFELADGVMLIVIAITTAIGAYIFYGISITELPGV
jgi:putative oxidoreductase